jgi:hypothetical protein
MMDGAHQRGFRGSSRASSIKEMASLTVTPRIDWLLSVACRVEFMVAGVE